MGMVNSIAYWLKLMRYGHISVVLSVETSFLQRLHVSGLTHPGDGKPWRSYIETYTDTVAPPPSSQPAGATSPALSSVLQTQLVVLRQLLRIMVLMELHPRFTMQQAVDSRYFSGECHYLAAQCLSAIYEIVT